MTKVKSYLGKHCLISIYYSLVYSHLIYGCSSWGNNYDSHSLFVYKIRQLE